MTLEQLTLRERFIEAVVSGELGRVTEEGVVVTLREFKAYFSDITSDYVSSFLPAATLEPGQTSMSHTKFLFRVGKGVYLVHSELTDSRKS